MGLSQTWAFGNSSPSTISMSTPHSPIQFSDFSNTFLLFLFPNSSLTYLNFQSTGHTICSPHTFLSPSNSHIPFSKLRFCGSLLCLPLAYAFIYLAPLIGSSYMLGKIQLWSQLSSQPALHLYTSGENYTLVLPDLVLNKWALSTSLILVLPNNPIDFLYKFSLTLLDNSFIPSSSLSTIHLCHLLLSKKTNLLSISLRKKKQWEENRHTLPDKIYPSTCLVTMEERGTGFHAFCPP